MTRTERKTAHDRASRASISVSAATYRRLRAACDVRGWTMRAVVERAIADVRREEQP